MWRINNFMLAIVLAVAIFVIGTQGFYSVLSWFDSGAAHRETLDARVSRDDTGRILSTHAVSLGDAIEHDEWETWVIVPMGHVRRERDEPAALAADMPLSVELFSGGGAEVWNNLALRNKATGSERLLFEDKVAIFQMQEFGSGETSGLAAAFADTDTNADGKIDRSDLIRLAVFKFAQDDAYAAPFEGRFAGFARQKNQSDVVRFRAALDFDGDRKIDAADEPIRLYEISFADGSVRLAVSQELIDKAQAIIDGAVDK